MSLLEYKNEEYDLSSPKDRARLFQLDEYISKVADIADKWYSGSDAFQFKTSGTTGAFKTISHSRKRLEQSAQLTIQYFQLTANDSSLLVLDPTRIAGAMMVIRSLINKMAIIALEPTADFGKEIVSIRKATLTAVVPIQLSKILNDKLVIDCFKNYKAMLAGGAPINSNMQRGIIQNDLPIYETFGMTETVTHFALRDLRNNGDNPFEVVGNHSVKQSSNGCLILEGDLTDNKPLATNDIIHIIDDKHFNWVGRSDFIINTGGVKVNPEDIERRIADTLYAYGIQNRYVVSSIHDENLGEKIVLVLEGTGISEQITKELLETLKSELDKYEVPKEIRYLDKFPEAASSKINRKEIISILA